MGLRFVEILMEVEDRFSVRIPDAQAQKIVTVGDLYALVCSLGGRQPPDPEAWVDLRDLIASMMEAEPDDIRPETPLSDLD